jgi:citrate lyase subunit beta/citryl-CoA lyase
VVAARNIVRRVLDERSGPRPQLFVRVNDARSRELAMDLEAIVSPGLDGILLPQVVGVDDVLRTEDLLSAAEQKAGLPEGNIIIVPLLETAQSIVDAYGIAKSSARIAHMGSGVSKQGDIARSVGYRWTPAGLETLYMRSKVLVEMRAAGIAFPISGMWGNVGDLDGLRAMANQTRDLGYTGMMCIHPTHIPVIHHVFTPSPDEIAWWRTVIERMEEAQAGGIGAIAVNGELLDQAHVLTARQGLAFAQELGLLDGPH